MKSLLRTLALLTLVLLPTASFARPASAGEGWVIQRFDVTIQLATDGHFTVTERLDVDFGELQKHGIFRDIPYLYRWEPDPEKVRVIDMVPISVKDAAGQDHRYEVQRQGGYVRLKIGDPDRLITGEQTYVISYRVENGLNPFPDHDELYWNVTGDQWPATILSASATVSLPDGSFTQSACFVGPSGSTEPCAQANTDGSTASFSTDERWLWEGEGMTVVLGLPKGVVQVDPPLLRDAPRSKQFTDYVDPSPLNFALGGGVFFVFAGFIVSRWRARGRDRRYTTVYQLTGDQTETTAGFGDDDVVVVEYTPPDKLRPAELGVVIDERADTTDVSATIVDLAARGYLSITEQEKEGWFGKPDYQLTRLKDPDGELREYETMLFEGLFDSKQEIKLSDLKNKFYKDLAKVKKALYGHSVKMKHFPRNPESVRTSYVARSLLLMAAGLGASVLLAYLWGAALVGAGAILGGFLVLLFARAMPARTAKGREIYRRALGFKKFIEVADRSRQEFYEQAGIFERYLPYAMMFGSVRKWAKVFEELGIEVPEPAYYHGATYSGFQPLLFANAMSGFNASLGTAMASTPGGSGRSGFSGGGGSSGGGGGGGGGGSW